MIGYYILGIALIGTIIGSYTDLKIREVSNWISYGLILSMLVLRGIEGFLTNSFTNFFISLGVGTAFFIFGLVLFYAQQWGGADLKLLTMLGVGFSVPLAEITPLFIGVWPFYVTVIMNFFIIAAFYSIVFSLFLSVKNPNVFSDFKAAIQKRDVIFSGLYILAIGALGYYLEFFFILLIFPPLYFLAKYLKIIEKTCLKKELFVKYLREFDIPETNIIIDEETFATNSDPNGLTLDQIKELKKLVRAGKIPKKIIVKWGVPLIPAFPLTIIATVYIGDIMNALITFLV